MLPLRKVFLFLSPVCLLLFAPQVPRDGTADTARWHNVTRRVQDLRAGGGTSFKNAFAKIKEIIFGDTRGGKVRAQAFEPGTAEFEQQRRLGRQGQLVEAAPSHTKLISIVFMTDGNDNGGSHYGSGTGTGVTGREQRAGMVEELRRVLAGWDKDVVVHTVGFSKQHDYNFLDDLRRVGHTVSTGSTT
jgi:hypothetical protein